MSVRHLFTSSAGVQHFIEDEEADGSFKVHSRHPVESDILEQNKAMATHNDGYSPSRELRRVASIPVGLMLYWKNVEGWDCLAPENADRLKRVLNSSDFMWLRTAPGRV